MVEVAVVVVELMGDWGEEAGKKASERAVLGGDPENKRADVGTSSCYDGRREKRAESGRA
jgi:hypothetical protein